ncbi:hypothetical protein IFM89_010803 [Coptis chinensis]|uniref:DUF4283 domain-containing protein n=1 Tax=Coptis chinensis TaxID=261450 RepID=A0A835IMX3_9MAGN|nr:hypothetical protein IFM89_010803 [Coptis chinensis]
MILKYSMQENGFDLAFEILEEPIGKEYEFEVRITKYNYENGKDSSLTVSKLDKIEKHSQEIINGVTIIPKEIISNGVSMWEDYLVRFFLENRMFFPYVKQYLTKKWRIKRDFDMIADSYLYYFKFTNVEDKLFVMEAGLVYMAGNCFIVMPWSQKVERRRKTIKGIPIWVNHFDVPKELWSEEGLGVVASRLGKPLLMDEATASRRRIAFARVCVEIEISSELPQEFEIEMDKGDVRTIKVE